MPWSLSDRGRDLLRPTPPAAGRQRISTRPSWPWVFLLLSSSLCAGEVPREPKPPRKPVIATRVKKPEERRAPSERRASDYYAELARVHARYYHYDEAAKMFEKAIGVETDAKARDRLRIEQAEVLARSGKPNDAVKTLEELLGRLPEGSEKTKCHLLLAELYERQGNTDKAAAAYRQLMAASPTDWQRRGAMKRYLALCVKAGTLDDLVAEYEGRFKKNPADLEARDVLIEVYTRVKPNPDKAIAVMEAAAAAAPTDVNLQRRLALAHELARRYDEAIKVYTALAQTDETNKAYYYERIGNCEAARGNTDIALKWARRITEEDPDSPAAIARFARICQRLGRNDEAFDAYQKAADLAKKGPQRDSLLLQAATLAMTTKNDAKAETILKDLATNSTSQAIRAQAKRYLFSLYEKQGRLDQIQFETKPPQKQRPPAPAPEKRQESEKK